LHTSPEALQSCAAQAVEGTETCDDRIALSFFLMEENLIVRRALELSQTPSVPSTPVELQAIARGLYKSEVLRAVANQKVDDIKAQGGFIDITEIILKYLVQLSTELDLPSKLQDMIFHRCARDVSDADIDSARRKVMAADADTPRFQGYLATWEPWREMLKNLNPDKYAAAMTLVNQHEENQQKRSDALLRELEARLATHGEYDAKYLDLRHEIGGIPSENQQFQTQRILDLARELRLF
jgi:hypothetical protein